MRPDPPAWTRALLALGGLAATAASQAREAPTVAAHPLDVLANGSGELRSVARGRSRGQPCFALDGWQTEVDGGWLAQVAPWGDLRAVGGDAFLRAAARVPGELRQDVPVTARKGRELSLLLSGWTRTGRDRDRIEVAVALLDGSGHELLRKTTGERGSAEWARFWLAATVAPALAQRVAHVRVTLAARHVQGDYLDAFAGDAAGRHRRGGPVGTGRRAVGFDAHGSARSTPGR